ncbi:hypothetical protein J437_LFUL018582 [Ladona fulva]|uniref:Integrase catalytic domain-containing protein n=1 Tax=Ladona fulva TaxID=123851 RepID=A0A8K0KQ88_LADFU|nr:hypothetical protein J437_LFUL018582 [Ladona fulva]
MAKNLRYHYSPGISLSGHGNVFMSIPKETMVYLGRCIFQLDLSSSIEGYDQSMADQNTATTICSVWASWSNAEDQDLWLQLFLLSYRNTPHATTGKAPADMFLGHHLPTQLDCLKLDPRNKVEIRV